MHAFEDSVQEGMWMLRKAYMHSAPFVSSYMYVTVHVTDV